MTRSLYGGGSTYLHFLARQLTALTGLGALGNLDLQLIRICQVVGCHAKAAAGNLLDGRALHVAGPVRVWQQAPGVLTALTCKTTTALTITAS